MALYTSALVAVALDEDSTALLDKARQLTPAEHIHLAHIEEHPVTGYGDMTGKNHSVNELHIRQSLFPQLRELATPYAIPGNNVHIEFGDPAPEILALAQKLGSAVIIAGSHGKHGLGLLRSSVLKDLIQGANRDILSVYTGK